MCVFFKKISYEPKAKYKDSYINLLNIIGELLFINNNLHQKNFINTLISDLNNEEFEKFEKKINSIDMWGGSGAIWEVYFSDKNANDEFEKNIIELINLIEKSQKLKRNIKSVRKMFLSNKDNLIKWNSKSVTKLE